MYCGCYSVIFWTILQVVLSTEPNFNVKTPKNDVTDSRVQEIQKLRSELNAAFEKHEDEQIAKQNVIVQPAWTQAAGNVTKSKQKVVVTNQGLKEAQKLRDEINKAVKTDTFIPKVSGQVGGDTKAIKILHQQYNNAQSQARAQQDDMLGSMAAKEVDEFGPNIIESSAAETDIDIRKLQRLQISKRRTREVLILKSIEEDFSFNLGEDIEAWAHILHNGSEYFIGRRSHDLQIIHKDAAKYEKAHILEVGKPISDLETYTFWNTDQQKQEGIILVSTENRVLWYRSNNETGKIQLYWEWMVGNAISGLKHFTVDSREYLVVSSNESSRVGYYALNIYQFELHAKEFWITQRLQLQFPCSEVAFLDTGRHLVLAITQNDTAAIYTFNPSAEGSDHVHFKLSRSIKSEGIQSISAFKMGGRSYLALGGMQPQILLYQQGQFVPKTIFGNNFGLVELFFPIPVRTYRDDLLLLVQHRVDFSSHNLTVLESLTWDGEAFEASIPAPCHLGPHTVYGVGCMLDLQRDAGLKGATLLRRGDETYVIVPRHRAESGLFHLHTELLGKNSELLDLQEIFEFLKNWVKQEDELVAQAQQFLASPLDPTLVDPRGPAVLDVLKTPELYFNGEVNEIYLNDYRWTNADSQTNLERLIDEIDFFGEDLMLRRPRRASSPASDEFFEVPTFDSLEVDELDVDEIVMENLNGERFYIQNGSLEFDGTLNIANLRVLGKAPERLIRQTASVMAQLEITGDIEFEEINGHPWKEIRDGLVFRDKPVELENLDVEGEIVAEDDFNIETLNELQFPDDFLWSSGPQSSVVKAEKVFTGTLAANAVDTHGLINGVNPLDAITLSDPQEWTGLPTFAHLEVSEKLELNGSARGQGLSDFPSNPTLQEAKVIKASCDFANLQVLGPVIVQDNKFDNHLLSAMLDDLVQRPEDPDEEIVVPSQKTFHTVEFPIDFHIENERINDIRLDDFVTLNTRQDLNLTDLKGHVYFKDLRLNGSFDGINITDLINNTLKIDKPLEDLETHLNFANAIEAAAVNVADTLNGVPIAKGYQTLEEDLVVPEAEFENLRTETARIPSDIEGQGTLNGIELRSFLRERSYGSAESPPVDPKIYLNELILEDGLEADQLYNFDAKQFLHFLKEIDELPEMISSGKIQVDNIMVTGNVQVSKLNDLRFDEDIQMTAIWLDRPNFLNTNLSFAKPLVVQGDLTVNGDYNGQNMPDLISDIVFRTDSETTQLITAPKNFKNSVKVLQNVHVDALNGIPMESIANKRSMGSFNGTLKINGNLIAEKLNIAGHLNEYPMSDLESLLSYDGDRGVFILKGNITLPDKLHLQDLTVLGDLNEFRNLGGFFENIVFKNAECRLAGSYNFTGRVQIKNGARIEYLNGLDLGELFNNIVFINDAMPVVVEGPVQFAGSVKTGILNVHGSLRTSSINGCSLKGWQEDTLLLNRPQTIDKSLRFAPGTLDGNQFYASHLNDIDLSKVITLNTEQNLSSPLRFSEVYLDGPLYVEGGLVNNVDFEKEYANTVMIYGDQHIKTPTALQTATVLGNLESRAVINNGMLDLNNVATLYGDLVFEAPMYFQQVQVPRVEMDDLMSNINFTEWHAKALWLKQRPTQTITGNWTVRSLELKNGPSMPSYVVENMRVTRDGKVLEELFSTSAKLLEKESRRPYALKYLKEQFLELPIELTGGINIKKAFHLQKNADNYLLVNAGCWTTLFSWLKKEKRFQPIGEFKLGPIDQMIELPRHTPDLEFMTNSQKSIGKGNCSIEGLNLWSIIGSRIAHLSSFDVNATAVQRGLEQNVVYIIETGQLKEIRIASSNSYEINDLLPSEVDLGGFHFLPKMKGSPQALTNGSHMMELSLKNLENREKRLSSERFKLSVALPRATELLTIVGGESFLKPDVNVTRQLSFGDFKPLIEVILVDLDARLSIEVNVTQLSIPESDLFDEHLIQDFIDIMMELQLQQIYPSDFFEAVDVKSLDLPDNPAQVLAARTVQIVWPVIVEIVEVHSYLRYNDTVEHPAMRCIIDSLGLAIHDVLHLANVRSKAGGGASLSKEEALHAVIERIRQFQSELKTIIEELQLEILEDRPPVNREPNASLDLNATRKPDEAKTWETYTNLTVSLYRSNETPSASEGEVIGLLVGAYKRPRPLFAVTKKQVKLVPDHRAGIVLYSSLYRNEVFQAISADNPRSIATLRIRDLTLLAFIEDCCRVRILQYKGIQGFVPFSVFQTKANVTDLLMLSLPTEDLQGRKFYLVTVLPAKLVFYEFILTGFRDLSSNGALDCIDC